MKPRLILAIKVGIVISIALVILAIALGFNIKSKSGDKLTSVPSQYSNTEQTSIVEPSVKSELVFGGVEVLPKNRFVALYGSPEYSSLGSLGEQSIDDSIIRVKDLTAQYQTFSTEKVVPTFEIITTVASAGPTENNDYSQEISIEKIQPWIDHAVKNGVYVVLDLQPGRSTFLEQAKMYEPLLSQPNVGLALDPEWRLQAPTDKHLVKVGSVTADEINQTSEWLADLTKSKELPQKIFIIHQFKMAMIQNRESIKSDRPELGYVIHMDGHGSTTQKIETWNRVKENIPNTVYMGWKNFYDEDKPTMTPEQTMHQLPQPSFISYQ